jgi:hypothetical protein
VPHRRRGAELVEATGADVDVPHRKFARAQRFGLLVRLGIVVEAHPVVDETVLQAAQLMADGLR